MDVGLDVAVDPLEAGPGERRAGREHGAQPLEAAARRRHEPGGAAAVDEAGAGAEVRHLEAIDRVPQHVEGRMRRRPVVEHDRRAFGQRRDQPVPHHPAAGGEVEQPIAGADVAVQAQLLVVLQQHAAGAVHQRLGQAGRAGRIEDRERVIEGKRLRGERRRTSRAASRPRPRRRGRRWHRRGRRLAAIRGGAPRDRRRPCRCRSACRCRDTRTTRAAASARSGGSARRRRRRRSRASRTRRSRRARRRRGAGPPPPARWRRTPRRCRRRRCRRAPAPPRRGRRRGAARRGRSTRSSAASLVAMIAAASSVAPRPASSASA